MNLRYLQGNNIVFVDKPAGISTHASEKGVPGLVELYEKLLNTKLFVVHRLDKTTSGAIAFATTLEKSQELFEDFKNHKVTKKYLFLTDRRTADEQDQITISTPIEDQEASTDFRRIKRSPYFELWEAVPKTGRTHQIRIHAQKAGLAILGDETYGGKRFPRICLHAAELNLPGEKIFASPPPRFFDKLGMLKDEELCKHWVGVDRRHRMFQFLASPQESLRLSHFESEQCRIDLFGSVVWAYWYDENDPTERDLERLQYIARNSGKKLCVRKMKNRGVDPNANVLWSFGLYEKTWIANENGVQFILKTDSGLSPGLFLDQRENRKFLRDNAKGKTVLNLFSYTCGFSVFAALGGAIQVTSVDVSLKFLEWGKENFKQNNMPIENHEFVTQDSLIYLNGCLKRGRKFDFIICDPPSFGRNKDKVFSFEKNWQELLDLCLKSLNPKGTIMFSFNFEKWSVTEAEAKIKKAFNKIKIERALPQLDFEFPQEEPLLKSFRISY